jgi:putative holliday junction resolvase
MPVGLLKDIMYEMPRGVRLLGMDVGAKTIGLAVCDPDHSIATPLKTISRTKFTKDVEELAQAIEGYEIGGLVIGLPLNMDGSEGRRCQSVRDFALELAKYPAIVGINPWIALWDERLSTETVEDFVDKSVNSGRRRAKARGITDKLAARHILQTALDFLDVIKLKDFC